MKKVLLFVLLLSVGSFAKSQKLDDIRTFIILTQYDKAKTAIDNFLSDAKNTSIAEAWYFKAFIYNALTRNTTKPISELNALNDQSFLALKKHKEADPKEALTNKEENATLFNVYNTYYDFGLKNYAEKKFEESYNNFVSTLAVHDYIYENNYTGFGGLRFSAHDTDIVWNLAVLGNELKKKDEVFTYYKKIADADLPDEKYAEAYETLVKFYQREDNAALFNKYLGSAKKHYPTDPYWESLGITFAIKGLENEALFTMYDELMKEYPNSYIVYFNYGYELSNFIYSEDAKGKDVSGYKKRIPELFNKAISINSTTEANMLMANYYYNLSFDALDVAQRIKGTTPPEIKRKKEMTDESLNNVKLCIPYGEAAVGLFNNLKTYKTSDKINFKQGLDILIYAYKKTGDAAKVAEYEKKKGTIDGL